jgi:hypothetical protein
LTLATIAPWRSVTRSKVSSIRLFFRSFIFRIKLNPLSRQTSALI